MPREVILEVPEQHSGTVGRLPRRTLLVRRHSPPVLLASEVVVVRPYRLLKVGPPQLLLPELPLLVVVAEHSRYRQPLVNGQLGR